MNEQNENPCQNLPGILRATSGSSGTLPRCRNLKPGLGWDKPAARDRSCPSTSKSVDVHFSVALRSDSVGSTRAPSLHPGPLANLAGTCAERTTKMNSSPLRPCPVGFKNARERLHMRRTSSACSCSSAMLFFCQHRVSKQTKVSTRL